MRRYSEPTDGPADTADVYRLRVELNENKPAQNGETTLLRGCIDLDEAMEAAIDYMGLDTSLVVVESRKNGTLWFFEREVVEGCLDEESRDMTAYAYVEEDV